MQTCIFYYIAIVYNKTLKKDLQKKTRAAKVLQRKKGVQQKVCKTKKNYASAGFEPTSVSTTTSGRCLQLNCLSCGFTMEIFTHIVVFNKL